MSDIARRFSHLIFEAVGSPETVDRNALLEAASAFLDASPANDSPGPAMARRMAFRACDWCIWPERYKELTRAADIFRMSSQIIKQTSV